MFANLLVDEMMHNEESDLYSEDVRNYLPFSVTIPSGNEELNRDSGIMKDDGSP